MESLEEAGRGRTLRRGRNKKRAGQAIDIDGIGRCAQRRLDPHEACWLRSHGWPLTAYPRPCCFARVAGMFRSSTRATGSSHGRRCDVAVMCAMPGCCAVYAPCVGAWPEGGRNGSGAVCASALRCKVICTEHADNSVPNSACVRRPPVTLC